MPRRRPAVSGPGAGSSRTDLAPGGQKLRVPPAKVQGDATQAKALQQAAPLAAGAGRAGGPPGGVPAGPAPSVFRPTDRPSEAPTSGIPFGAGSNGVGEAGGLDFYQLIQVLHSIVPDPALARMIAVPPGRGGR